MIATEPGEASFGVCTSTAAAVGSRAASDEPAHCSNKSEKGLYCFRDSRTTVLVRFERRRMDLIVACIMAESLGWASRITFPASHGGVNPVVIGVVSS